MFLEHSHHVSILDWVVRDFRLSLTLFLLLVVDVNRYRKVGWLRKHDHNVLKDLVVQHRIFGFYVFDELKQRAIVVLAVSLAKFLDM